MSLGQPREHHETIGSTNERARELAEEGAAHGTLVTAGEQTAGRGRQGRGWVTPPGRRDRRLARPARVRRPAAAARRARRRRRRGPRRAREVAQRRLDRGPQGRGHPRRGARPGLGGARASASTWRSTRRALPPEVAEIAGTLGRDPEQVEPTLVELLSTLEQRPDGGSRRHARRAARPRRAAGPARALAGRRGHGRRDR